MSAESHKFSFKITVVGDGGVGKTSLIRKFTQDSFSEDYIKTIGAQFSKLTKILNEDIINIIFWDIAGQNDLTFLRPSFYRNSNAAIIVYSLEDNELGKESIGNIGKWSDDVQHFCGAIPLMVLANKVDLVDENTVKQDLIQEQVKNYNLLGVYITSAKTGKGVTIAFERIIEELYQEFKKKVS